MVRMKGLGLTEAAKAPLCKCRKTHESCGQVSGSFADDSIGKLLLPASQQRPALLPALFCGDQRRVNISRQQQRNTPTYQTNLFLPFYPGSGATHTAHCGSGVDY